MHRLIALAVLLLAAAGPARAAEAVSFAASDGGKVFGEVYPATAPEKAVILLFHQAGSNRGEYAPIAPKLAALGYDALAIDQRAGGSLWGEENETVAEGRGGSFSEALADLGGTLTYARARWPGKPIILWGSSYSASLVFLLAARHPDEIAAVLSFSPGEYLPGTSVRAAAAKLKCPVFITSASDREEIAAAKALFDAGSNQHSTQYVPQHGTHGSSTLRTDADAAGAEQNWQAVTKFLGGL